MPIVYEKFCCCLLRFWAFALFLQILSLKLSSFVFCSKTYKKTL